MPTRTRERASIAIPGLIGLIFLFVYLLSGSSDLKHNGDTDLRYQTTQALVDHHRLWIQHPMWLDDRVQKGRGGHLYAFYAPGQTLLMVPLYEVGKALAHHLALPYPTTTLYACRSLDLWLGALLAILFYVTARALGYSTRVGVALTFVFGLATVAWPDAQSGLEQTQVDLALLASVLCLWLYVRSAFSRVWWLFAAVTAAGAGLLTRYDFALYLPLLWAFPSVLLWRSGRRRHIVRDSVIWAGLMTPWIAGIGLWDYLRFGNVFTTGLKEATFGEPFFTGVGGLLISPGKGIIWYMPVVWLAPWAARDFWRRQRQLAAFFAALVLVPLVFYSNLLYWHGDPAWGPRYLYTAVPYMVLPLGELFTRWSALRLSARAAIGLIVLLSAGLQLSAVSVSQWRFWYRLQAIEETSSDPFQWGATHYHYYWTPRDSPILLQMDDVYQVARLQWQHQERYRLVARPTSCTRARCLVHSNPADNYPINDFSFWWSDTWKPLMGAHRREGIATGLGAGGLLALCLLVLTLRRQSDLEGQVRMASRTAAVGN